MIAFITKILFPISCVCIFLSCAGQYYPSGGPPDTTPPEIILATPAKNSLNVQTKSIALKFSKYVDRRSVEESIFLSPPLGRLKYDWGGTDVEITFVDSLHPNTTYIMTIGTDVKDTRGNTMASSFALAFSTGEHLDSAWVSGKVFDDKPAGVMIFAYRLDDRLPDTLNPTHLKPDYATQTGKNGTFNLTNLALGTYRLIAVRDAYKNLVYDPQTDQYGTATHDIVLTAQHIASAGLQFQLTEEDTTPPFLSSARPIDRTHLLLRFSEAMDTSTLSIGNVSITDTVHHMPLAIHDLSFIESPMEAQLTTAPQESTMAYRAIVLGCKDVFGNVLNEKAGNGDFTGSRTPDTLKASVQIEGISDSARNIPAEDTLRLQFTKAVRRTSFEHGFHLMDSSRKDVQGTFLWYNSAKASFVPSASLKYGCWYTVRIVLDSLIDLEGSHLHDSVLVRRFKTIDEGSLSSMAGTVIDDSSGGRGKIVIIAKNIASRNSIPKTLSIDRPGAFMFSHIPEGKYTFYAFRDADSNGVHDCGKLQPYAPSERFVVYPDTLKVRARWPLEGINIRFK